LIDSSFDIHTMSLTFSLHRTQRRFLGLLGLCDELDRRMKNLIDTYQDEWASVVKDPERRRKFDQVCQY
jgi:hypothetical protein